MSIENSVGQFSSPSFDSQNLNKPHSCEPRFKMVHQFLWRTNHLPDYPTLVVLDAFLAIVGKSMHEPQTYSGAMNSLDSMHWNDAMKREFASLNDNEM